MMSGASAFWSMGYNSKQVPAYFLHLHSIPLRIIRICLIFWCVVVVSMLRYSDCIVLVRPFVYLCEVEDPLIEVVKHTNLYYMEEVRHWNVAHDATNTLKHMRISVNTARHEFGIGYVGVDIAENSILVVITPGVFLVRWDIISKFFLWTLATKTDMPFEMI